MMDRYLVTSKNGKKFWRRKSPRRRKLSAFGSAFAEARKKFGKGKTFTFKGKKYSTNMKGESSNPSKKQMVDKMASDNNLTKK